METSAIVEVLSYANGHDRAVRLVMRDGTEVTGVPSSIDLHPTAHEVFLRPAGDEDTEIAVSLAAIRSAALA
jgi:hypothetical protein